MSGVTARAGTVLHVSPHADDECIAAPATLMELRDAHWRIVNLACSAGRGAQRARRLAELRSACDAAGFVLELVDQTGDGSAGAPRADASTADGRLDDTRAALAEDVLVDAVAEVLQRYDPAVVVAPSPHDRHPGHEVVGRAVLSVLGRRQDQADSGTAGRAPRLWLWGLWADLPFPTLACAFGPSRLDEVLQVLGAYGGELERNDYRRMVRGRAEMNASLGPERVFGFGSAATDTPYAELLCEVSHHAGAWRLGTPRWLDPSDPLGASAPGGLTTEGTEAHGADVTSWLSAPSLTSRFGPPPSRGAGG